MIVIRAEIAEVEAGQHVAASSPLRHAPHTAGAVGADEWNRSYTRENGAYPDPRVRERKYWAPVSRMDNVHDDRDLVCTCLPMEELM